MNRTATTKPVACVLLRENGCRQWTWTRNHEFVDGFYLSWLLNYARMALGVSALERLSMRRTCEKAKKARGGVLILKKKKKKKSSK
jgi:hypothetical protein